MSTLQHTPNHPAIRTRIAQIAVLCGAAAALLAALVIGSSNGSSAVAEPHPAKAQIERQLQSVSGARYDQPVRIHEAR